ncbi:MAG: DUF6624 domain-containing protein [Planctomycetota bacterium]
MRLLVVLALAALALLAGGCASSGGRGDAFAESIAAWAALDRAEVLERLPQHLADAREKIRLRQEGSGPGNYDPHDPKAVAARLAKMFQVDQLMRREIAGPMNALAGWGTDEPAAEALLSFGREIDSAHTAELKQLLQLHHWFTISEFGPAADQNAWLLAQHADLDVDFQREVLARLTELWPVGETSPRNFAYLYDRVARAEGRPQRYGTQGACAGPGRWEPHPLEDPERVDELRAAMGLEPLEAYVAFASKMCP